MLFLSKKGNDSLTLGRPKKEFELHSKWQREHYFSNEQNTLNLLLSGFVLCLPKITATPVKPLVEIWFTSWTSRFAYKGLHIKIHINWPTLIYVNRFKFRWDPGSFLSPIWIRFYQIVWSNEWSDFGENNNRNSLLFLIQMIVRTLWITFSCNILVCICCWVCILTFPIARYQSK